MPCPRLNRTLPVVEEMLIVMGTDNWNISEITRWLAALPTKFREVV